MQRIDNKKIPCFFPTDKRKTRCLCVAFFIFLSCFSTKIFCAEKQINEDYYSMVSEYEITPTDKLSMVEMYIGWYLQNVRASLREKAQNEYAPLVVRFAQKYEIDPLLLAVVISCESSWRIDVIGKMGEHGLTQIHGLAGRPFEHDLHTAKGQIEAGARWLSIQIERCGGIVEGLSAYMTGRCKKIDSARRRYRAYKKAREQFATVD